MAILMCMDSPVYNTVTGEIFSSDLMPCAEKYIRSWRKSRLFLKGINRMPEEEERVLGEASFTVKRRFSLSDSYWFKYSGDSVLSFFLM